MLHVSILQDHHQALKYMHSYLCFNPLNAELNPICHLLALLGGATIVVVSRLRVKPCILMTDDGP